jgi:hypothetical protein
LAHHPPGRASQRDTRIAAALSPAGGAFPLERGRRTFGRFNPQKQLRFFWCRAPAGRRHQGAHLGLGSRGRVRAPSGTRAECQLALEPGPIGRRPPPGVLAGAATLTGVATPADEARRRRIGIALVAAALALFVVQMVALALGSLEVAGLIFVVYVAGWFALRSWQRRSAG